MSKKKSGRDPYAGRESEKYENPIASREFILDLLTERGKPMRRTEVADELKLNDDDSIEALRRRMQAMVRDGQLIRTRRGAYGLVSKMDLVSGKVDAHRDGFGFFIADETGDKAFIGTRQMQQVLTGDRVLARLSQADGRGRREASIVEVIERNTTQVVGRFMIEEGMGFVEPDNPQISHDILIAPEHMAGAESGQIVVAGLLTQPTKRHAPSGQIIEILGDHMAPGMEIDIAVRAYSIPYVWPNEVLAEADKMPTTVTKADCKGRKDLRKTPFVTIDGEDARDFDDAVFCERRLGGGFRLYVAIADVSHYVQPGMALDTEAEKRGNSVYFPENVIPMLPEVISNGLCSLNPKVDRLAFVCEMTLDSKGKLQRSRFYRAVIESKARLTYTIVAKLLAGEKIEDREQYLPILPHIENLHTVYLALQKMRGLRGAIDFETRETQILFDADRKIDKIIPRTRNVAHKIIEECMILANVAAAKFVKKTSVPALYRVHEGPGEEKLLELQGFLKLANLPPLGKRKANPKDFANVLLAAADRPDRESIQLTLLRSLRQAVYQPENAGHFGLSLDAYAHFTSPIRRYPDLLLHRAIGHIIDKQSANTFTYDLGRMKQLGEHCSMSERRADSATWDVTAWLKCEFLMDKVGECFWGRISGVTGFGIFVELEEFFVEGLVHVTDLKNDYYAFDGPHHTLTGERTGNVYRLGQRVKIQIAKVNLDERKIDFVLEQS